MLPFVYVWVVGLIGVCRLVRDVQEATELGKDFVRAYEVRSSGCRGYPAWRQVRISK